jgi:hypothetical protein
LCIEIYFMVLVECSHHPHHLPSQKFINPPDCGIDGTYWESIAHIIIYLYLWGTLYTHSGASRNKLEWITTMHKIITNLDIAVNCSAGRVTRPASPCSSPPAMTPRARDVNKLAIAALFLLLGLAAAHPDDDGGGKLYSCFFMISSQYFHTQWGVKNEMLWI